MLLIGRPFERRSSISVLRPGGFCGPQLSEANGPGEKLDPRISLTPFGPCPKGIFRKAKKMKLSFRRVLILFAAMFFALATGMTAAHAVVDFSNAPQGAHFAKGSGEPDCTVSGTTVTCTGTRIEGVGNTNATVLLTVTSTISGVCHNPGVNSKVVEPFSESVTESTSSDLTSTRNGRLLVPAQTTTGVSTEDFLADFTCPNENWEPEVDSNVLSFEYTLTFAGFTEPAILITG